MNLSLQGFLFLICVFGSFFFSGSETGFVSWNPLKVAHRAGQGSVAAKWALYLMNHKDRLISSVLIGNNVCNIGATFAFLTIYEQLDVLVRADLSRIPSPESWVLTPLLVLFGEMLPKSLFRTYPFRLTMKSIPLLMVIYWVAFPFTLIFSMGTSLLQKQKPESGESFMTKVREEMVLIAVEGSKRGTLFESAKDFIDNALKLKDRRVADLMRTLSGWQKDRPSVLASQPVQVALSAIIGYDELVVFDKEGGVPCGYVTVLDLVSADPESSVQAVLRHLPAMNIDTTLLAGLQQCEERYPRFIAVTDDAHRPIGLLDRMDLFQSAFGRINPDFNPKVA